MTANPQLAEFVRQANLGIKAFIKLRDLSSEEGVE